MKILVTGGTGYIGSHTVVELQQLGHEVHILDNLSNSGAGVLDGIEKITGVRPEFVRADVCNYEELDAYFAGHNFFDGVIHFAALKAVGESVKFPAQYYRNNVGGMANLLLCMEKYGVMPLVFSSSCTVYGQPDALPVDEDAPVKTAMSPYGNTKQVCEEMIADSANIGRLRAISLRYFNPIGAHESALIGELPLGVPNNLVPYITQTAIGKREALSVFGNDYDTPDGTCIRDYIHVVDIAQAHVAALNRLSAGTGSPCEIFNLGTGKGNTVLEVIHAFEKVSGIQLKYRFAGRRAGDITAVWADASKANRILGWKAEKTLEQMMQDAWEWEIRMKDELFSK
jgi:UDP-glucose 4-epimerase